MYEPQATHTNNLQHIYYERYKLMRLIATFVLVFSMSHRFNTVLGSRYCTTGGTAAPAAAAPPPFRPGKPALCACGSRTLVTPYYCRLGDLLCYIHYSYLFSVYTIAYFCVVCVFFLCRFSFSTLILLVGSFDL